VVTAPSPVDQVTAIGLAMAVALTDPTVAVTRYGCQTPALIHIQVGKLTMDDPDGLNELVGTGNRSDLSAARATERGLTF
jgi:hypothetical protein